LRPESMSLAADDETAGAWAGEVVGRRFAGGHTVYRVRTADGAELEVMGDGAGAREGERTRVRLTGDAVAVVRA
ncbi:MAG: TOBE domain-containing protein, partial [Gemmatimonadaceae bacterium]|nr:TOBE domain-containing protein [Gemmatimonadaceae bacterium]